MGTFFSWKRFDRQCPGPCSDLVRCRFYPSSSLSLRELASRVFSIFWNCELDLVARKVVCQPTSFGGFGVVSIELKACALRVQCLRRLVTKPASWVHFFYYYFWLCVGCSLLVVLSRASSLYLSLLPPFHNSVLPAWQKVNGAFSNRSGTLAICASGGLFQQDVSSVSTKLVIPTFCPPLTLPHIV